MLPILLLLVLLLHHGYGLCCPNFRRWCRRYDAVFTAADAAITLRRGQMLLKFSPLVPALGHPFFRRWCTRYAAPHVLLVFGAGTAVCAVARRGLFIVLGNDYVTTSRRNTAALFCLPRYLSHRKIAQWRYDTRDPPAGINVRDTSGCFTRCSCTCCQPVQ